MTVVLSFPGGVRVWDQRGEVVQEFGDEPLRAFRGRLMPVRDKAVVYAVYKHRWVRRQLSSMPRLTASQRALGARAKRDLSLL